VISHLENTNIHNQQNSTILNNSSVQEASTGLQTTEATKSTRQTLNHIPQRSNMGKKLQNCRITIAGDFGIARSVINLKNMIEHAGAIYAPDFDDRVTHLVCSLQEYNAGSESMLPSP
jgi:hypothetical protein